MCSHSYSSSSMLGKNDTEVAAIVPVYYTLYLISIDDGMGMMGIRWLGDGVSW